MIRAVAVSHDGQLFASVSYDKTVELWDLSTGKQIRKLEGHDERVRAVAFSHDGQLLASASNDRTVRLWDPSTGEQIRKLEGHDKRVKAVAFSHDGQLLASASVDRTIRLWDPSTGEQVQELDTGRRSVKDIVFSTNDAYIITNLGRLEVQPNSFQQAVFRRFQIQGLGIDDGWITFNNEKLVWLPWEWECSCSAISSTVLVIGTSLGRLLFVSCSI